MSSIRSLHLARHSHRGMRNESMHLCPLVPVQGIFVRNLAQLNKVTGKYTGFLAANAHSVWTQDRNSNNLFGFCWEASTPFYLPAHGECRALCWARSTPRFNSCIIEERAAAFVHLFEQHPPTD
jgi:hypothetical protein